jgi:quinohemoprotein ethanol dehydrogenase
MRRLVTFSLDGTADMPALPPPYFPEPIEAPDFVIDPALAQQGAMEYGACLACHGLDAMASGMAPDLRASQIVLNNDSFAAVVRDGTFVARGMPANPEITDAQLDALRHYVRQQARETL